MKTYLTYDVGKLIKKINFPEEIYAIKEHGDDLIVVKKINKGRPFSFVISKKIQISPEAIGLIVGEGFISDRHFVFANSNEKAISEILNFLIQFKLPIKSYLEISTHNEADYFINNCLKFWERYLNTKISKVRLRGEFNNITSHGTLHLIINNVLVAKLLSQIINLSKTKIEKNKKLSIDYLRGIFAAEGNVNIKKDTKCVYMVRISASEQKERDHYKRCLGRAGLKIYCKDMPTISKLEAKEKGWKTKKGRAGAVIISKWENFVKIINLGLLDLHEDKKIKFFTYLPNNKFTKQFLDFKYFLNKEFTMKDAQSYFKFRGRKLNRVLTLYRLGYLSRKKINKVKFSYKLTNKYTQLYNNLLQTTPLINGEF